MKNNKYLGNTNLEIIMTMVLLILFASSVYTMVYAGSTTQKRILDEKQAQVNARVATSYLNVKIKQNDVKNRIEIRENPNTGDDALVLVYEDEEGSYDTWIYFQDGKLQEELVGTGEFPTEGFGFEIAKLSDFEVSMDDKKINTIIYYEQDGKINSISNISAIRSSQSLEN